MPIFSDLYLDCIISIFGLIYDYEWGTNQLHEIKKDFTDL